MKTVSKTKTIKATPCMRCYLLEKQIHFLEQLLQMKQDTREMSVQTEESMETPPSPASSSLPDFLYEEDIDSCSSVTQVETTPVGCCTLSDHLPEPTAVIEISLRFFPIKTEDKGNDVLFVSNHCRTHFLQSSDYFVESTVYEGRYVSLRRLECLVETWNHKEEEDASDREQRDQIRFFLSKVRDRTPFYHRIFVQRDYGNSTETTSFPMVHYSLRIFRFSFEKI